MESEVGLSEALTFASAAPFIAILVGLIKSYIELPSRIIPPLILLLVILWGIVLWVSGYYDGDLAVFIVTAITVAAAASGIHNVFRTYNDDALRVGPNAAKSRDSPDTFLTRPPDN